MLVSTSAATAQQLTNTTPYTNIGIYAGDVVSNTSSINNASGSWTGTIESNAGGIYNMLGATWDGDVTNTGTVVNNGAWTGDVEANNIGTISNRGADALWTGDVVTTNSQVVNEDGATWKGNVLGDTNVLFNMADSFWIGDVIGNDGQVDNRGDWQGDVRGNAGTVFNEGEQWTGNVYDNTGSIGNGFYHPAEWLGVVVNNHGVILNNTTSTWDGNVLANAGSIGNYGAWNGNLTTTGKIINTGVWTGNVVNNGTYFRAQNQIIGSFDNRGALQLTGDLSGITTFTNSGVLDLTQLGGGQTLSAGTMVLTPSSSYKIDVTAGGASDRIVVGGAAQLGGTVSVVAAGGAYASPTDYTILTAGSVEGTFAGVTTDLAFFAPHLSYDDTSVILTLKRNDVGLPDIGKTPNQRSVGATVQALGAGNPIYDAALWLTAPQAQQAFDQLAGEGYGPTQITFIENASLFADMMTGRLDRAFDALRDGDAPNAYAAAPDVLAAVTPHLERSKSGVWGEVYGARGLLAANAETTGATSSTGGFTVGLDGLAGDWRLGMMVHAGTTVTDVAAVDASSRSADYGVGVYAGTQWGQTRLSLGADYTRHYVNATRQVAFPGFTDSLSASYAANTAEAFGKLSQHFDLGVVSLTPYASLAYVRQETDGFTESGGPAALNSATSLVDATFATLGVGADRKFAIGDGMLLTAKGALGWRHALGGAPDDAHALADGTSFSVVGAPIAGDTAIVNAGFSLDVSAANTLDLSYDGQLGLGGQTHVLKGTWAGSF